MTTNPPEEVDEEDFNDILYVSPPLVPMWDGIPEELKMLLIGGPDFIG